MAYKNQQHFIDILEREGELIRIKEYVNPKLEMAEITDRVSKSKGGGKALLFENKNSVFTQKAKLGNFRLETEISGFQFRLVAQAVGAGNFGKRESCANTESFSDRKSAGDAKSSFGTFIGFGGEVTLVVG